MGEEFLAKCHDNFMNLRHNMSVNDYKIEFLRFVRYASRLVTTDK